MEEQLRDRSEWIWVSYHLLSSSPILPS